MKLKYKWFDLNVQYVSAVGGGSGGKAILQVIYSFGIYKHKYKPNFPIINTICFIEDNTTITTISP